MPALLSGYPDPHGSGLHRAILGRGAGSPAGGGHRGGAAASEITPWPSEGENDPVSIDPADYGIVYDTEHMPDWETCPLSYLCAYYLGADGAYAQGAMDTLAQRYRQAPNTVQNYLNTLAAKYAGVDRQLLSQIRLAAESLYGAENGTSADPLVGLLYNESFDYSDGVGNSGHYTYRVPQLLADTGECPRHQRGHRR